MFNLKINKKKVLDLVSIFFILGLPKLPFIGVPLAFFSVLFYTAELSLFYKRFKGMIQLYIILFLFYFTWGCIAWGYGSGALQDLLFFFNISSKIIFDLMFGVILSFILIRNFNFLKLWLIIQSFLVVASMISLPVYNFLINFISSASADVFSHIFSLKAIGFGIYHVSGSVILILSAICYFSMSSKENVNWFSDTFKWYSSSFISLLVSRSALIPIFIYGLFKKPVSLLILFLLLVLLSTFVTEGVVFRLTEMFRNLVEYGSFSSASTSQNMSMFKFPSGLEHNLAGYGMFYENVSVLRFFQDTDLGVSRLSLYGGWPLFFLFYILNAYWLFVYIFLSFRFKIYIGARYFSIVVLSVFTILLFKDISFITVFGVVPLVVSLFSLRPK